MNFTTIKNNGKSVSKNSKIQFSNQCLWISIIDYLKNVHGNDVGLDTIRQCGSKNNTPINGINEQFDAELHIEALSNVASEYNLCIFMHKSTKKDGRNVISVKAEWTIGDQYAPNIVAIVSHGEHFETHTIGGHFELITSIGEKKLYEKDDFGRLYDYPFLDFDVIHQYDLCEQKRQSDISSELLLQQINELTELLTSDEARMEELKLSKDNATDDDLVAAIDFDIITLKNAIVQTRIKLIEYKESYSTEQEKMKSINTSFTNLFI